MARGVKRGALKRAFASVHERESASAVEAVADGNAIHVHNFFPFQYGTCRLNLKR